MKQEGHLRHFRSKYLCANTNPNLGQQCKEKSWAEETLTWSWFSRVLWWENVEEMGGQILGYNSWKPISIRRSSKMWIYQVFSCRKFVTSLFASCSKNHNLVDFHRIELVPVPKFHKLSWLHFHRRYWVQTVFKRPSFFAQSAWHAENPECWILFHLGRNFENS